MQIVTFSKKKERAATNNFFLARKKHQLLTKNIFKKIIQKKYTFFRSKIYTSKMSIISTQKVYKNINYDTWIKHKLIHPVILAKPICTVCTGI